MKFPPRETQVAEKAQVSTQSELLFTIPEHSADDTTGSAEDRVQRVRMKKDSHPKRFGSFQGRLITPEAPRTIHAQHPDLFYLFHHCTYCFKHKYERSERSTNVLIHIRLIFAIFVRRINVERVSDTVRWPEIVDSRSGLGASPTAFRLSAE